MPAWARLVTAVAVLRVAAALALYLSGQVDTAVPSPIPAWAYAVIAFSFGTVGAALVLANRKDVRAAWLGGVLLLIASPLCSRLLSPAYTPVAPWVAHVHPDAFLAAFAWRFLMEFPSALGPPFRRAAGAVAAAAILVGAVAAAVNLSIAIWPMVSTVEWRTLLAASLEGRSWYWPAVFVPSAAAFVGLLARMTPSSGADLFRVRVFVGGLAAGLLPVFVEVATEEAWPWYKGLVHQPAVEPWVGLVLFAPFATVPFLTAYSVVYERVVEMRVVMRAALRYLLARYTIIALASVPFAALTIYLFQHRTEVLVTLVAGPRPLTLIGAVLVGLVSLRARRRWLLVLDRRFFREQYDEQLLLTHMVGGEFISSSPREIAERLASEIGLTLHARADLFVVADAGDELRDPRAQCPPIGTGATLVSLAMANAQPMDVRLDRDSALERLPDAEKAWIANGGYRLMIPLRTRSGEPAGLLALGEKRSELAFSDLDRRSLGALAAPIALAIENERLRHTPEYPIERPARECLVCSRMYAPDAAACRCGGALAEAVAPHTLRGVFRFDRRIGTGGMGIVYRAFDLNLGREVAIKTLPRVTPEHVARLRHEAQAMALMVHANLAVIYGIETWRGVPFLVEEYLAGGTLADRLRLQRMAVGEALDLGITLAGVLAQLHSRGIVHCDIKPSNIGFSGSGVVKLLDFGLAHLLRGSGLELTTALKTGRTQEGTSLIVTDRGVMGTPVYMSPEALHAERPSPGFDLWALAVVLYEAIAGRRPFTGADAHDVADRIRDGAFPDLRTIREDCGEELARFFSRTLAVDASLRPANAETFGAQISSLRAEAA
jgi:serine/threonine-protein kinase